MAEPASPNAAGTSAAAETSPQTAPAAEGTVRVTYVGEDTFIHGDRLVQSGESIDLPAEEVDAWGDEPPTAFQKEA